MSEREAATCPADTSCDENDVRILRRVELPTGPTGQGLEAVAGIAVVVDVETTGVDHDADVIIELAARRFAYDERGVIIKIDRAYSWRQDPQRPLSDEIVRITGLNDADLAGTSIDEVEAARIIGSADIRIAHNAAFDRPFVEERLPAIAGREWACSMQDVDWAEQGFESTKLGWILTQCGYFHGAHRAAADVDATIQILRHEIVPGRTALEVLLGHASTDSWIVRAFGAAFGVKDLLRARRYRWNPLQKVWWKEVRDREAEEAWLAENIYCPAARSHGRSADLERVTWRGRYGR